MSEHSLLKRELEDFIADIAAATPTPGGGSAAAASGAVAAALLEMATGVSTRRTGADEDRLNSLGDAACRLRRLLAEAVEGDARAYAGVEKALKLPRGSEDESRRRRAALQEALLHAARIPLTTAEHALQVLQLAEEIAPLCGKQLTSDVSCAVRLAYACVRGALDNVDANALSIRDDAFRQQLKERRCRLEQEAESQTTTLLADLEGALAAWR